MKLVNDYLEYYTRTLVLNLSKASFRLNIRLRSRIFAALRCDTVATLRLFFDALFDFL